MSGFSRQKQAKNGLRSQCKICDAEYQREYHKANREKEAKYRREYRKANREKLAEYSREYRETNREKMAEYDREYYKANREKIGKYHKANSEKLAKYGSEWRKANPGYQREYNRKRMDEDIQYKLASNLRNRLYGAIKGGTKNGSAVSDLGCSIEELKIYLEVRFENGMSWDNWSRDGWHIDHIIPLSSFDLTDREQLKKACHYTNLQPLWAKDNLSKHDKISGTGGGKW